MKRYQTRLCYLEAPGQGIIRVESGTRAIQAISGNSGSNAQNNSSFSEDCEYNSKLQVSHSALNTFTCV